MGTKDIFCQYIPIKETIKLFLSSAGVYKTIQTYMEHLRSPNGETENIFQSQFWNRKKNQILPSIVYRLCFIKDAPLVY